MPLKGGIVTGYLYVGASKVILGVIAAVSGAPGKLESWGNAGQGFIVDSGKCITLGMTCLSFNRLVVAPRDWNQYGCQEVIRRAP
jgi:hypothetical protein